MPDQPRPSRNRRWTGLGAIKGRIPLNRVRKWLTWPSRASKGQRWFVVLLLAAALALLLFPSNLIRTRDYSVGDVVARDIKASRTYLVEDAEATETRRQEVAAGVLTVYDLDDKLIDQIKEQTRQAFDLTRTPRLPDETINLRSEFEAAVGLELDDESWLLLEKAGYRVEIEEALNRILRGLLGLGVVASPEILSPDEDRGLTIRRLKNGEEKEIRLVSQIRDLRAANRRIAAEAGSLILGPPGLNDSLQELVAHLATQRLRPNLTPNRHETDRRRQKARESVGAVFQQVLKGEMLAREGEIVTPQIQARLIKESQAKREGRAWMRVIGMFLLLVVLLRTLYLDRLMTSRGRRLEGKDLVFIAATIFFVFLLSRLGLPFLAELARPWPSLEPQSLAAALPVAVGAMLVSSLLGLGAALLTGLVTAFLAAQLTELRLEFFALFLASSITAARAVVITRNRSATIKAGLWAGLVGLLMVVAIRLVETDLLRLATPFEMGAALIGGLLAGVIVIGLTPLVEILFGYTTDAKLGELVNLDQPVLKEFLFQAPGSYHHSIIVGNMVEAAAETIGANPLLAKVAAYYHDVGKVKKPLYFIENQTTGENKHEKLAPSMSSLVLIAHVKDGIEIARKAKLGKGIEDIIAQHHGTSLITYFYDKALKLKGSQEPVNIDDFRYPGPKPQTKEAGLVMLGDQVEAVCKTLTDPTPARVQGIVQRIINRAFSDGQLSDCELTLKDLHAIAKSFNKVLNGIFHQRVAYPAHPTQGGEAKRKANGDSTPQRPISGPGRHEGDQAKDKNNLKRLGIS